MKKIIRYAKPYWMQILLVILSGLGCSMANVFIVDILKQVIDLSVVGELVSSLPEVALEAVLVILAGMLANYLAVRTTGRFGAGILRDMRRDLVNHIMKISPDFMEKQNFGDIMERSSSDVGTVAGYIQDYFKDCLYVPIMVAVFAAYLVYMNPLLAVSSLAPLLVLVPLSIKLLNPVKMAQMEYVRQLGLTNNHIQEAFDGADVIKSYNLQKKMQDKYYGALKETLDISNKNDLRQYNIEPLSVLIREAPTATALCLGGYLALKGEMTLGILVAFISGIKKINEPLVSAYQLVVRTQMAMISARRVFEILDMPVEQEEKKLAEQEEEKPAEHEEEKQAEQEEKKQAEQEEEKQAKQEEEKSAEFRKASSAVFEFENVSFRYSAMGENRESILEHFNLSIREGKKTALVGRSGSGKSTVLKLMCRQYEADGGEIYFYGNPFRNMGTELARSQMALISQEPVIFPMSVRDNIRIGNPDAGQEEIAGAAKKAGCHEFITGLPEGYDTLLEERGNNLSGGQRQRIAIARAILKDAPVILLDEPTSALDKETEERVNKTLLEMSAGRTVITVAHRLNTIVDYDEIIVMEEGRIVEAGTHEELMDAEGKYCRMYGEYVMAGGRLKNQRFFINELVRFANIVPAAQSSQVAERHGY